MTQSHFILEIRDVKKDQLSFEIRDTSNPSSPTIEFWEVDYSRKVQKIFCDNIKNAVIDSFKRSSLRGVDFDSLINAGRTLYEELVPEFIPSTRQDLRQTLRDIEAPLLISIDDPKVFWELLHDGEDFFAIKYQISRQVRRRGVPPPAPRLEKKLRCLIIANPTNDLKNTLEETQKLEKWLTSKGITCDYLKYPEATLENIINKLTIYTYDFIHYAGHIECIILGDNKKEYALKLSDDPDEMLRSISIKRHVKGNPFVFLNGCWSSDEVRSLSVTLDYVDSITDAFLEAGAQVVTGSLFPIPDDGARAFAEKYYELILQGNILGEALRGARIHVKNNPDFGSTWACFVMYGDPCLQIKFEEVNPIEHILNSIDFSTKDFEIPASRIIEQAISYGKPNGRVSTANLFAALIVERGKEFEDIFQSHDIKFEEIKGVFKKFFTLTNTTTEDTIIRETTVSKNVEAILKYAKEVAKKDEREKISDKDLSKAFLEAIGKPDIPHKDIYLKLPRPQPPEDILKKIECHSSAWEVLTSATEAACRTGSGIITTAHFFIGLLSCPSFLLYRALRQHGISPIKFFIAIYEPFEKEPKHKKIDKQFTSYNYSENVKRILYLAKEINQKTNGNQISDRELLSAFVQFGGGSTGQMLAEFGIDLSIIFFDLFSDEGVLLIEKFDDTCKDILENAKEYAINLDSGFISSLHLFYGICSSSMSNLGKMILNLGFDLDRLDSAIKKIISHRKIDIPISFSLPFMTRGIKKALFLSANICKNQNLEKISEKHLIEALLTPKKGSVKIILKNLEINPEILLESYL